MEKGGLIDRVKTALSRESIEPQDVIYKKFQQLQRTPSSRHAEAYKELKSLVIKNQDALHDLIFSGKLSDDEIQELVRFGGHGGSVAKKYNKHWAPFMARVRERQDELPESLQRYLDWQKKVHDW
jgi:hypothetical protein